MPVLGKRNFKKKMKFLDIFDSFYLSVGSFIAWIETTRAHTAAGLPVTEALALPDCLHLDAFRSHELLGGSERVPYPWQIVSIWVLGEKRQGLGKGATMAQLNVKDKAPKTLKMFFQRIRSCCVTFHVRVYERC